MSLQISFNLIFVVDLGFLNYQFVVCFICKVQCKHH